MKKIIASEQAPKAVGPYSQGVEASGILYISGQLPIIPETGAMPGDITAQTEQCLKNTGAILHEAGLGYSNVVKVTVLLDNMEDFAAMNIVYARYFTSEMPARICYEVARLPMGAKVEIDSIAVRQE